jgi:hypothetical protein
MDILRTYLKLLTDKGKEQGHFKSQTLVQTERLYAFKLNEVELS